MIVTDGNPNSTTCFGHADRLFKFSTDAMAYLQEYETSPPTPLHGCYGLATDDRAYALSTRCFPPE